MTESMREYMLSPKSAEGREEIALAKLLLAGVGDPEVSALVKEKKLSPADLGCGRAGIFFSFFQDKAGLPNNGPGLELRDWLRTKKLTAAVGGAAVVAEVLSSLPHEADFGETEKLISAVMSRKLKWSLTLSEEPKAAASVLNFDSESFNASMAKRISSAASAARKTLTLAKYETEDPF